MFRIRKSAGIRVTLTVHALIHRGNKARSQLQWSEAAAAYEKALAKDPGLAHIWIQLAHMYKEAGRPVASARAYAQALDLRPDNKEALGELFSIAPHIPAMERFALSRTLFGERMLAGISPAADEESGLADEILFDISDLVAYFGRARFPTGIQRVQIEIIRVALNNAAASVRICCAMEGASGWSSVSVPLFLEICEKASNTASDAEWLECLERLRLSIWFGQPIKPGKRARLINLGTSWWLQNYFLQIRNARQSNDLVYVPFVHDLIPVLAPQFCVSGLIEDFMSWLIGVFEHADAYLVNSEATKRDFLFVAAQLGHIINPEAVTVIPLDGEFSSSPTCTVDRVDFERWGISSRQFVLFVSTIESRKGHMLALEAWRSLLDQHGDDVPMLVCVGNDGWLNASVYEALDADMELREHVVLLSRISDAELNLLYRECQFTIYPSFYEGWGLPITEALSHGKIVVTADNSSLPEAGGKFARYIPTGSAAGLADAVGDLAFNADSRERAERLIRDEFRPRSWARIAQDVISAVAKVSRSGEHRDLPRLGTGRWYDLSRSRARRLEEVSDGRGEMARIGQGWAVPGEYGNAVWAGGAQLRFRLPSSMKDQVMIIRLSGHPDAQWTVSNERGDLVTGQLGSQRSTWIAVPLEPDPTGIVTVTFHGECDGKPSGRMDDVLVVRGFGLLDEADRGLAAAGYDDPSFVARIKDKFGVGPNGELQGTE